MRRVVSWGAAELRGEIVLWQHLGMEVVRRAVQRGGVDGVNAGGVLNRGQSTAGFLCRKYLLSLCLYHMYRSDKP